SKRSIRAAEHLRGWCNVGADGRRECAFDLLARRKINNVDDSLECRRCSLRNGDRPRGGATRERRAAKGTRARFLHGVELCVRETARSCFVSDREALASRTRCSIRAGLKLTGQRVF